MEENPVLNAHNKDEYPPAHTAEHILNQTMVRMFGCPRSMNAHIEKKKSKCDYDLGEAPSEEQICEIEARVNEVISMDLEVRDEYMTHDKAAAIVDLRKLPSNASDTLRVVRIGDYDACACLGTHVKNTSEIGTFKIISHEFIPSDSPESAGRWRVRWKLINK